MEPNNIDKHFSDQIHNDQSEMNLDELKSKESIWDKLEVNQEVVPSAEHKSTNWFLKIAAAILLIGLGTTALILNNKLNAQTEKYATLKNEYQKVTDEVGSVSVQLNLLEEKINSQFQAKEEKEITSIEKKPEENNSIANLYRPKVDTLYIAKTTIIKDTVFSVQRMEPQEIITYVRDTVFMKLQETQTPVIAETNETKDSINNNLATKSKKPKKVEFIFGPKPIEKPNNNGIQVEVNGSVIAKKQ